MEAAMAALLGNDRDTALTRGTQALRELNRLWDAVGPDLSLATEPLFFGDVQQLPLRPDSTKQPKNPFTLKLRVMPVGGSFVTLAVHAERIRHAARRVSRRIAVKVAGDRCRITRLS